MSTKKGEKSVARLVALHGWLSQYREAYYRAVKSGSELSAQMYAWIDEYNDLRGSEVWDTYCEQTGFSIGHNAGDIFA